MGVAGVARIRVNQFIQNAEADPNWRAAHDKQTPRQWLAKQCDVAPTTISNFLNESGQSGTTLKTLDLMIAALGVPLWWFFDERRLGESRYVSESPMAKIEKDEIESGAESNEPGRGGAEHMDLSALRRGIIEYATTHAKYAEDEDCVRLLELLRGGPSAWRGLPGTGRKPRAPTASRSRR